MHYQGHLRGALSKQIVPGKNMILSSGFQKFVRPPDSARPYLRQEDSHSTMTTSIKTKLEVGANVTVVLMALAVGGVVLTRYMESFRTSHSVEAGDRLGTVPGLDWHQHQHTLVLALNTGCHYCKESAPFYQKLAQAQRPRSNDVHLVAAFPNTAEAVGQFTQQEGLNIPSVGGVPFEKLRVNATPTLILVNQSGQVEKVWIGVLTAKQEMDLLKLAEGS